MVVNVNNPIGLDIDGFGTDSAEQRSPGVTPLRKDLQARVDKVVNKMPSLREDHGDEDHGGHGHAASKSKKPPIDTIDVDWADVKGAFNSVTAAADAFGEGLLDKPTLTRALDDTLGAIPLPGMEKARYALPLIMWTLGKVFNIPDHKPEKVTVDYGNLSGQILNIHHDHGRPTSFHHGLVALLMCVEETELRDHYSSFFEQATFTAAMSTADGRKDLKEEFGSLFGKKVKTRAQFLVKSRQMLERMGATFVTAAPDSPVAHVHPLRERHANHSLHVLQTAIENARAWITDANIAQITKPVEDVNLNKDVNKFGDTLMEHVKGNTGLATKFLGNLNLAGFDKAFHSLMGDVNLEEGMYDEAEVVKEQICQLFNFSPKENISAADLNSFTETLIGPPEPPATHPFTLHADNGGNLGLLSAIPATDTDTRTKWTEVRRRINEARNRLLEAPDGTPRPFPPPPYVPPTRLSVLFPPRSAEVKYSEFGIQLGRAVRRKEGANLERARSIFLRGWELEEFNNHYMSLLDAATLAAAVAGSKTEKDPIKAKITELTGLNVTKVSRAMFIDRITAMREALGTVGGTVGPVNADVDAKRRALDALLAAMLTPGGLQDQIQALYLDANLDEKLGEALQSATDAATVTAILDRISPAFLMGRYPRVQSTPVAVRGNPAAVPPVPPMSLTNQQLFKANVAAFIGAPKGFVWTDAAVRTMIGMGGGLRAKLALVPATHPGRVAMEMWIAYVDTFVATPGFIDHLGTLP